MTFNNNVRLYLLRYGDSAYLGNLCFGHFFEVLYVSWSPTVCQPSSGRLHIYLPSLIHFLYNWNIVEYDVKLQIMIVISINWMYKTSLTVCHFENFNRNKFHVFHDLISTIWIDSCFIYKILNIPTEQRNCEILKLQIYKNDQKSQFMLTYM